MNYRIRKQVSSLDALFSTAEEIRDEEIQAHFARYLCIKSSGLFENYIKSQIGDYVDSSCSNQASSFIRNKIKHFTNINSNKLSSFLSSFSCNWAEQFAERVTLQERSSLDAITSNRNNIAHGHNDSITFLNMKHHYENLKSVMDILDDIIT